MLKLSLRVYFFVMNRRLLLPLIALMFFAAAVAQVTLEGDTTVVAGGDLDAVLNQLVTEVVTQLQGGATLQSVIFSPPILAVVIGLLAGWANFYLTNTVKSYTHLKGWGTKLLAMLFSVVLGGGLGYLGLIEGAQATGPEGAWAFASLLIAWTVGEAKHENREQKRTGLRKVDRLELANDTKEGIVDLVVEGLILTGAAVGIPAAAIRAMYELHGREAVLKLIASTRAYTVDEAQAAGEATQADRRLPPKPHQ